MTPMAESRWWRENSNSYRGAGRDKPVEKRKKARRGRSNDCEQLPSKDGIMKKAHAELRS